MKYYKMYSCTYFTIILSIISISCNNNFHHKKTYYTNGSIKSEFYVDDNGLKQGEEKEYYENGVLKSECYYIDDTLNGSYIDYHINGAMSSMTMFKNGLQHGTIITYSSNGKLLQYRNYELGKKNGLGYLFYHNGNKRAIDSSKNDNTQYIIEFDSLGNITNKEHLIKLYFLNKPTISDSIKIKAKIIGFYDGGKTTVYTFIERYPEGQEGVLPKMRLNSNDSCFYYTFPPTKKHGKYNILINTSIADEFEQYRDSVFSIE